MPPGRRRYEIQLASKSGPIDVFLIQDPHQQGQAQSTNSGASVPCHGSPAISSSFTKRGAASSIHTGDASASGATGVKPPFEMSPDPYSFDLKGHEGTTDLYGFNDVFNVFDMDNGQV